MSTIIPGYDCDIHISYRFNDNKYDGWVTEFVEKLWQELGATLKDKLSIYFDKSPEEDRKPFYEENTLVPRPIKSLIFIPDRFPNLLRYQFQVWKEEFKGFQYRCKNDRIGAIGEITNGNMASRVIPVKIHDIDKDDVKLLESELAGALRSIDFIYREEGVNRPLRPADDEKVATPFKTLVPKPDQ